MSPENAEGLFFVAVYLAYLALLYWAIYPPPLGGWNPEAWEDFGIREWP